MPKALPLALSLTLALVPVPARALDASDLVEKHVAARGGRDRIAALGSVLLDGRYLEGPSGDVAYRWTRALKRQSHYREDTTLQGLTYVDAWDGREGWKYDPFQGRREAERLSADEAKEMATRADDLDGVLAGAKARGAAVISLGTEDVDGTAAHKLRVTEANGDVTDVFLDPDHFLEIRLERRIRVRGAERVVEVDLGSYGQVGGVWFPFTIEGGGKGRPRVWRYVIDRAAADVPLDDALFAFPGRSAPPPLPSLPDQAAPASAPPLAAAASGEVRLDAGILSGLGARNIGSAAMSGRISAVAGRRVDGKTTLYVGAASGGVWKSTDDGTTFRPVFDRMPVQSIGAIAIDPSDPRVVWVGTGESWTRNSVSIGDGVYRSTDGGETWTNMGLPDSERVSRIVIDPRDSNVVWACVPGRLWSDSTERGLYRTGDGGRTWTLALAGQNPSTGCSGVDLEPGNPDHVIAGLWDFRRKGWTFRSGGDGPAAPSGSGLFESRDGGRTFAEIAPGQATGLPPKPWGRLEVAFAPSNGKVVYAFVESTASALYRSADGGKTWERRDSSQLMVWRPFYFARLVVDPTNPDRLFKPDLNLAVSDDGGRSFSIANGGSHGDWHDLWIDPQDPMHVVGGDDGGLWISHDGANRWWKCDNLPVSQFYRVAVDAKDPYRVYGGLQDNSSWIGPSSWPGGITNDQWTVVFGGDGFWTVPDPTDPEAVYAESQGGYLGRLDLRTRAWRDIQPKAAYAEKLRFNWNTPVVPSPSAKGTIYLGTQFLFRSRDRGETWERISPDLTTNDPVKQKQEESGGITVDNSVAEMHGTLYSIAESPLDGRELWVGTDDGRVQLTRDGGKKWTDVTPRPPQLPAASWVSWVEPSHHVKGTAYATFDRHTFGDHEAHVYRTTDFGKTWAPVAGKEQGLRGWAHVVREDPVKPAILYVGTELGLWVSIDSGSSWARFEGGSFPAVAVRDLAFGDHGGDLVIATHGRGIWIVDDLGPLRALTPATLAKEVAFLPSRPTQQRMPALGSWVQGDAKFVGPSSDPGATVTFYQRTRHLFGPMRLDVLDPAGRVVDSIPAPQRRGLNRVSWSMQEKPPNVPRAAALAGAAQFGPRVVPGTWRVRLTRGAETVEAPLEIKVDRRAPYGVAERKAQHDAAMRVHALFGKMTRDVDRLNAIRRTAEEEAGKAAAERAGRLRALAGAADALRKQVVATKEGGAITGEERLREHADILYGALLSWEGKPARYQVDRIGVLERELSDVEAGLAKLESGEVKALGIVVVATPATDRADPRSIERALRFLRGEGPDEDESREAAAANERD